MNTVKCPNCGKEAYILRETLENIGSDLDFKSSATTATVEGRCLLCGLDFEVRGDYETVKKWKREHGMNNE